MGGFLKRHANLLRMCVLCFLLGLLFFVGKTYSFELPTCAPPGCNPDFRSKGELIISDQNHLGYSGNPLKPKSPTLGKYNFYNFHRLYFFNKITLGIADLGVEKLSATQARLSWTPVWEGVADAHSYRLHMSEKSGGPYEVLGTLSHPSSFLDVSDLGPEEYFFTIRISRNGISWGPHSSEISVRMIIEEDHQSPESATLETMVYNQDRGISWESVATACDGYELEIYIDDARTPDERIHHMAVEYEIPSTAFTTSNDVYFRVRTKSCETETHSYSASEWKTSTIQTVQKAEQSVVTTGGCTETVWGTDCTVTASGGDGTGVYAFEKVSGDTCSIDSATGVVSSTGAGTCVVRARRLSDTNYNTSSYSSNRSITLNKQNQTTVTTDGCSSTTWGTNCTVTASGGSGTSSYQFNYVSGPCSINSSSGVVSSTGAGTCVVRAQRLSDANYNTSSYSSNRSITLNKQNQVTVTTDGCSSTPWGTNCTVTASGGSGTGDYEFEKVSGDTCSIDSASGVVSSTGVGTCVVRARRLSDANYNTSSYSLDHSITLNKQDQSTVSTGGCSSTTWGTNCTVTASGGSGTGSYEFNYVSGPCSINSSSGVVSSTGAGTCVVRARRLSDANYNTSSYSTNRSITLNKRSQSTVSTGGCSSTTWGTNCTVTASGGSGTGSYEFNYVSGPCSINSSSGVVSSTGAGTCVVRARRLSDTNYNTSSYSTDRSITLNKQNQSTVSTGGCSSTTWGTHCTVTASGGSGTGDLFLIWISGPCYIHSWSGVVSSTAAGTCVVMAYRDGDINYHTAYSSNRSITLNKQNQSAPSTPTCSSATQTSINISGCSGCEFRRGTGSAQSSTTFTGLTAGTSYAFSARGPESNNYYASAWSANVTCSTLPLYSNGTACTAGSQCSSGHCYRDIDGDRYSWPSGTQHCQASSSLGTDCYDNNANARPGQTAWFTTHRGDNSFDYNCSGSVAKNSNVCGPTTCTAPASSVGQCGNNTSCAWGRRQSFTFSGERNCGASGAVYFGEAMDATHWGPFGEASQCLNRTGTTLCYRCGSNTRTCSCR